MQRLRTALVLCSLVASMLAVGIPVAQASSTYCNSGTSTGNTFYNSGGGLPTINESTAWRFEEERYNYGEFYVGAFGGDNATDFILQNRGTVAYTFVGQWLHNYPRLANSEKVTNYGQAATFQYNRTCTRV